MNIKIVVALALVASLSGCGNGGSSSSGNNAGKSNSILESYTSAGTFQFTVPSGVSSIVVETWGGGGGGGLGCYYTDGYGGGGGGGGGGYAQIQLSVTPGTTFQVTVGNGGGAGYVSPAGECINGGGQGGTSEFQAPDGTVLVQATGGYGGSNTGGGGSGGSGNGESGFSSSAGVRGGNGTIFTNSFDQVGGPGGSGANGGGNGGVGASAAANIPATNGMPPGGGGGGGAADVQSLGAAQGAAGQVIITVGSGGGSPSAGPSQGSSSGVNATGNVYWAEQFTGYICSAPKSQTNGSCTTIIATGQTGSVSIAVDSNYVYWTTGSAVCWAPKNQTNGGCTNTLESSGVPVKFQNSADITMSLDNKYFVFSDQGSGYVYACPNPANGAFTCIQDGPFQGPRGISSDDSYIYFNEEKTGNVWACPMQGGGACSVIQKNTSSGTPTNDGMALDSQYVYYALYVTSQASLGSICSVLKTGSGSYCANTIATNQAGPVRVALSGSNVFWTNNNNGQVCEAPKSQTTGGCTTQIASNQNGVYGIVTDSQNYVYWIDAGSGHICVAAQGASGAGCTVIATAHSGADAVAIAVDP